MNIFELSLALQRMTNEYGCCFDLMPAALLAAYRGECDDELLEEFERVCKNPNLGDLLIMAFFAPKNKFFWDTRWSGKRIEGHAEDLIAGLSDRHPGAIAGQLHRAAEVIETFGHAKDKR